MADSKHPLNERVNVQVAFKSFRDGNNYGVKSLVGQRKIMPIRFSRSNGEEHVVKELRATRPFRKGGSRHETLQIHYVVRTTEDRYFDLMFDVRATEWRVLYELDDQMMIEPPG